MDHYKANKELVKLLDRYVDKYPDQRFWQILMNYFSEDRLKHDPFYIESTKTLDYVLCNINADLADR